MMCVMVVWGNMKAGKCKWTGCGLKWYFIPYMEQGSFLETYVTDVRYRLPSTCSFYLKRILVMFQKYLFILSHLVSPYAASVSIHSTWPFGWHRRPTLDFQLFFETFNRCWCSLPVLLQVYLPQNRDKCWAIHWTQQLTIRFHKMQEIFLSAEEL